MSWNTTYRPLKSEDLTLTSVRTTVQQWLKQGWIPQALLFVGPKGSGKTTLARQLAAVLNQEQNAAAVTAAYLSSKKLKRLAFTEEDHASAQTQSILQGTSFAVREIDAASHRGIDDIRELKQQLSMAPSMGIMSVCILDEAHMLTKEAWNALLKILEEPPKHVIFVLVTTEHQKIPLTIQSRCQVLQFTTATLPELQQTLERVASAEKLEVTPEQLQQIALQAQGSSRDAIKLLERWASEESGLTNEPGSDLQTASKSFITALLQKSEQDIVSLFTSLRSQGVDEVFFQKQLLELLHTDLQALILEKETSLNLKAPVVSYLLEQFNEPTLTQKTLIPFLGLELKSLSIIAKANKNSSGSHSKSKPTTPAEPKTKTPSAPTTVLSPDSILATPIQPDVIANVVPVADAKTAATLLEGWQKFTTCLKAHNQTLAALVQSATPEISNDGSIRLYVYHQFHAERLSHPTIQKLLRSAALEVAASQVTFEAVYQKSPAPQQSQSNEATSHLALDALL